MLSDTFVVFILGMLILLIVNYIGYTRMPILCLVGLIGTMLLAVDTLNGLGDYYMIGFILILVNTIIPFWGITRAIKE